MIPLIKKDAKRSRDSTDNQRDHMALGNWWWLIVMYISSVSFKQRKTEVLGTKCCIYHLVLSLQFIMLISIYRSSLCKAQIILFLILLSHSWIDGCVQAGTMTLMGPTWLLLHQISTKMTSIYSFAYCHLAAKHNFFVCFIAENN